MDANELMLNGKLRFGTIIAITLLVSILASCSDEQEITTAETITAFINVNLVPMTAEVVVENQTVLVEQGKIIQIGCPYRKFGPSLFISAYIQSPDHGKPLQMLALSHKRPQETVILS